MVAKINPIRIVRLWLSFIVLAQAVVNAQPAIGQADPDDATQKRVKGLIESLVSPNKAPPYVGPKDDYRHVKIPADYDREAQRKVLEAWRLLQAEGIKAFPSLVASIEDNRYSCTVVDTPGDGEFNWEVGAVCASIMRNQIDVLTCTLEHSYGPDVLWRRAARENHFGDTPKWWRERVNRSLSDLQIESAQTAIEILKGNHHGYSDVERRKDIRSLEVLISQVKESGRPIDPIGIETRYRRMIGLPGESDRPGGKPHSYKGKADDSIEKR